MKMTVPRLLIPLAVVAVVFGASPAPAQEPAHDLEYNRDVRPVLARACLACHGPSEGTRQADLRLDTDAFIDRVVVPGDAEASPLFQRLTTGDQVAKMPPVSSGRSLTDEQIDLVRRWIDGGAAYGGELALADAPALPERVVDFAREVRPILSQNCFTCHGPDEQGRQRGLRLDVAEGPFTDRGEFGGPVILPGNADESLLIHRVSADDLRVRMPFRLGLNTPVMPGAEEDGLSADEVETLRLWIDQGAEWASHWAFTPPERPAVPPVADGEWPRNPIDNFVLAGLEADGLGPADEADRATLLRRASFDITGLPPLEADMAAFLNDDSPDAFENAVDRMLGSTAYGERMAVDWLEAARYADSSGYQTDAERSMWRYRDWVIDAFNENMPFDRFTIEQLAGDLMPDATLEQRIATAFNRNHSQNGEGGIIPEEFLVENVVDRVSTTGTVWMGLTLGCARCHDHKFDPVSQKEFYEIFAYFNNVPERGKAFKYGNSPPMITAPTDDQLAEIGWLDAEIDEARETFADLEDGAAEARRAWEASLADAGRVDWVLRDKLLVHYPLDGDFAGIYTSEPVYVSPNVTAGLRGGDEPQLVEFPVGVKLVDGTPRFVPGRVGEAHGFDGQRFIDAGDIANFTYDDPFTLSAWVHSTAPDGVIVSRALADDQGERGWGLYLLDGKVRMNLSQRWADDGVRVETVDDLPLNEWQHVLVTYTGKRVPDSFRIYVNGEEQELVHLLDGINNPMRARAEPLRIGASGPPPEGSGGTDSRPRFRGWLDDVRIYMQALTPRAGGGGGDGRDAARHRPHRARRPDVGAGREAAPRVPRPVRGRGRARGVAPPERPRGPAGGHVGELPHRHGHGRAEPAARDVPAHPRGLRRARRAGRPERAGDPAAAARRRRAQPARVRRVARRPRAPADRPGHGEPVLAVALRHRHRQDERELRPAGRVPQPPRAARLARHRVRRLGLGRQAPAADHRDQRRLPAGLDHRPRGLRGRPREPAARAGAAHAAAGAVHPRPGPGRVRPPRARHRGAVGQAPTSPRACGRRGPARPTSRRRATTSTGAASTPTGSARWPRRRCSRSTRRRARRASCAPTAPTRRSRPST